MKRKIRRWKKRKDGIKQRYNYGRKKRKKKTYLGGPLFQKYLFDKGIQVLGTKRERKALRHLFEKRPELIENLKPGKVLEVAMIVFEESPDSGIHGGMNYYPFEQSGEKHIAGLIRLAKHMRTPEFQKEKYRFVNKITPDNLMAHESTHFKQFKDIPKSTHDEMLKYYEPLYSEAKLKALNDLSKGNPAYWGRAYNPRTGMVSQSKLDVKKLQKLNKLSTEYISRMIPHERDAFIAQNKESIRSLSKKQRGYDSEAFRKIFSSYPRRRKDSYRFDRANRDMIRFREHYHTSIKPIKDPIERKKRIYKMEEHF